MFSSRGLDCLLNPTETSPPTRPPMVRAQCAPSLAQMFRRTISFAASCCGGILTIPPAAGSDLLRVSRVAKPQVAKAIASKIPLYFVFRTLLYLIFSFFRNHTRSRTPSGKSCQRFIFFVLKPGLVGALVSVYSRDCLFSRCTTRICGLAVARLQRSSTSHVILCSKNKGQKLDVFLSVFEYPP